jgi:hypothetical protein
MYVLDNAIYTAEKSKSEKNVQSASSCARRLYIKTYLSFFSWRKFSLKVQTLSSELETPLS